MCSCTRERKERGREEEEEESGREGGEEKRNDQIKRFGSLLVLRGKQSGHRQKILGEF